jgi:hypothetical protein
MHDHHTLGTVTVGTVITRPLLEVVPDVEPVVVLLEAGAKFAQRLAPVSAVEPQMHLDAKQHPVPNLGL